VEIMPHEGGGAIFLEFLQNGANRWKF